MTKVINVGGGGDPGAPGSSAYLVNQGKKIIANTTAKTTILKTLASPTLGTTYNSSVKEGDQFKFYAEGSYTCTGPCDFEFLTSLYSTPVMSSMYISLAGPLGLSNWILDITYTVVAISGTQVVVSQSGGLTWNLANAGPGLDYYASNSQAPFTTTTPLVPDPYIVIFMNTLDGTVVTYNASFSRVFRY